VLEDTLKAVKEAEAKADEIVRDADAQAASILNDAKAKAQAMTEETRQKVKSRNQEVAAKTQADGELQLQEAAKEAQREIEAMKELIAPKKKDAVKAVISSLV
jgi:vacuolar-type H+-ATPase subunit H